MIPVRCWSCGKVIAHVYEQYKQAIEEAKHTENETLEAARERAAKKALGDLGIKRYCCRRMFVGQVDLIDDIAPFSIAREQ